MPLDRPSAHGYTHQGATIPLHHAEGLEQWITLGRRPNSFLQAVLCNNLCEAIGWSDPEGRAALQAIVVFLYNEAPGACWGSPEKARAWRAARQAENRVEPEQHENSIEAPQDGHLSNLPHDA